MMDIIDSMMNYNEGLLWYHMAIITLGVPHSQSSNVNWVITWGGGREERCCLLPLSLQWLSLILCLKEAREGWGYLTLVLQFKGLTDCHLHHFLKRPYKSYLSK